MNFDLTEDRQLLSDTLTRYLSDKYRIRKRNDVAYAAPYHDPERWSEMAGIGIAGALVPGSAGGFGGTGFDISVVFEALGRALCPEPFLGALLASRLLLAAGEDQAAIVDGSEIFAVALGEIDAPYGLDGLSATARRDGSGYRLTGRKSAAYGGNAASVLLVVALLDGRPAVFRVEAAQAHVTGYGMIDGGGACELLLDETPSTLLIADAAQAVEAAVAAGQLALCAEAVGVMSAAYELLLGYLGTRRQFGASIGSFQAIQHRAVDLLTEIEQARSITIAAAAALDTAEGVLKAAMAKNLIGRAARLVAEETLQLHGGIGMTWEYAASHYAKRLVMLDHQLGDTDHCLGVVIESYAA